jgi:hypothetical protein
MVRGEERPRIEEEPMYSHLLQGVAAERINDIRKETASVQVARQARGQRHGQRRHGMRHGMRHGDARVGRIPAHP